VSTSKALDKPNSSQNFDTRKVVNTLEGLMEKVTAQNISAETVNAACNCADRIVDILRLHLDVERLKRKMTPKD